MGRCYSRKEYVQLVDSIRRRGDIALSTDIICGFCGETEEEFQDTVGLMKEVEYHSAFIFKYSERKNTIAGRKYSDDVPESIKSDRVGRLIELQRAISARKNQGLIGHSVNVLVEGDAKKCKNQWMGHTESNTTVVWKKAAPILKPGDLVSITVEDGTASTLYGVPASS